MRIGEFAKQNDTSIDTIRHYMDLGLLVPEKRGTFYYFDDRCSIDLRRIVEMKDMGFSLNEIKQIFFIRRFSKMTTYQEIKHYRNFFVEKRRELNKEIDALQEKVDKLDEKIEVIEDETFEKRNLVGLDINNLSLFLCKKCDKSLRLFNAEIDNNLVINGSLKCECGTEIQIEDGIVIDKSSYRRELEEKSTPSEGYFIDYVNETSNDFLDIIYKSMEWCYRHIDFEDFSNHVILELGIGDGIFLSHVYSTIPDDATYIAVDYDINKLKYLKVILEHNTNVKNIILLCADFEELPIRNRSIDYVIDIFGSTSFSFRNNDFLPEKVRDKLNGAAHFIALFMHFDKFKKNGLIPYEHYHLYKSENIKKYLLESGYNIEVDEVIGYADKAGKHELVFDATNRIFTYGVSGKYSGK